MTVTIVYLTHFYDFLPLDVTSVSRTLLNCLLLDYCVNNSSTFEMLFYWMATSTSCAFFAILFHWIVTLISQALLGFSFTRLLR